MKLSHSKLNCILSCPMSYYLQYEEGMYKKEEKAALAIGSAVHWGIEHNTEDLSDYFNLDPRNIDNYTRDQLLSEAIVHGYFKHKDELFDWILTDPETGETLTLLEETHELYLTTKLKSNIVDNHEFVGIIDLLMTTNKGFIIVDYKTGSGYPEFEGYIDQLYRYIEEVRQNFPDVPIVKIAIIYLRKTGIRQKKNENAEQFKRRMQLEYELNDEAYVNYHEWPMSEINQQFLKDYINNLSRMCDVARTIVDNKLWYINYSNAKGTYGKSDWYDIFYKTPDAEVLYGIKDRTYNPDTEQFEDYRNCIKLDLQVVEHDNVLHKYSKFKELLLATDCQTQEEFYSELSEQWYVDKNLLDRYWLTFVKEKEVKDA